METGVRRIDRGEIRKDARGWVVDLVSGAGLPMSSLAGGHAASLEPGAVRGNHYHENASEWLLLFGGPARVLWQSPGDRLGREVLIQGLEPAVFEFPPRCAHRIENVSSRPIYLMAFYDRSDPDSVRFEDFLPGRRE